MSNVSPFPKPRPVALSRERLGALVLAYCERGDLETAAASVGLSLAEANAALRAHGAAQMVARAMRHQIGTIAAPRALAEAMAMLDSPATGARVKADIIGKVMAWAGFAQPSEAADERALHEMSASDLRSLIDRLTTEAEDRAAAPPPEADLTDWLA
jgi:hypothetical protein